MPADDGRAAAGLHRTIPALPVRDVPRAAIHYRERIGFEAPHATPGFAVLTRDDAVLHLGGVGDTAFGTREFATLDLDGNLLSFYVWVADERS